MHLRQPLRQWQRQQRRHDAAGAAPGHRATWMARWGARWLLHRPWLLQLQRLRRAAGLQPTRWLAASAAARQVHWVALP